jgi:hypothetical protein
MEVKGVSSVVPMLRIDDLETYLPAIPYYTPNCAVSKKALEIGLDSGAPVLKSPRILASSREIK